MKNPEKVAQGKKSKRLGAAFEVAVRKDLEKQGYFVDKWTNNIDLDTGEIVKAKTRFFRGRPLGLGSGFPDFLAMMPVFESRNRLKTKYRVILVECKTNNTLSKTEKLKMNAYIKKGIECWVAYKDGREKLYRNFVEYKERNRVRRKKIRN